MTKEKLLEAQAMIKAKRFDEAAAILNTMPDNPTAQEWLARIRSIQGSAPPAAQPAAEPVAAPPAEPVATPASQRPRATLADDDEADAGYQAPQRKTQWEYAILEQNVNRITNTPMYRVEFCHPDGDHDVVADSDFEAMTDFLPVFKQVMAQMGMEGWEMVTLEVDENLSLHKTYIFKRLVEK